MRTEAPDLHRVTDPRLRLALVSRTCAECRARLWLERTWRFEIGVSSHAGRYAHELNLCTSCALTRRDARLYAARESADRVDPALPGDDPDLSRARTNFRVPEPEEET